MLSQGKTALNRCAEKGSHAIRRDRKASRAHTACRSRLPVAALCAGLFLCLYPQTAYAYLDPGTGSMLLSAVIGIAATGFFLLKSFYYRIVGAFYALIGKRLRIERCGIVFYSEGGQYWTTFSPIIDALIDQDVPCTYLTSDEKDPGLSLQSPLVQARYIGEGNRAFTTLNMLEADICILTTPGLDVLQIRRSPGVRHYTHVVHSPTDVGIYKCFSFDWFDSVFCSGSHQMQSLRALEALRRTPPKLLLETGCCYMDVLASHLSPETSVTAVAEESKKRILVSPTWGNNGLLSRFGLSALLPLAESGHSVCIRPHPQSRKVEKDLLQTLKTALQGYPNVSWDEELSPYSAMRDSDIMISDISGIIFDYAFVLEKPVITLAFDPDLRGLDAADLPWPVWELGLYPRIGKCIETGGGDGSAPESVKRALEEKLRDLPALIKSLPKPETFVPYIREVRGESLFNYRMAGKTAARQLISLLKSLREEKTV